MNTVATLLAVLAVGLVVMAAVAVLVGEVLFAGLCMLATTFVIYLRETRT